MVSEVGEMSDTAWPCGCRLVHCEEHDRKPKEVLTPDPDPEAVDYGFGAGELAPMSKAMLFFLHFKDSPEPENIPNIDDWHPGSKPKEAEE